MIAVDADVFSYIFRGREPADRYEALMAGEPRALSFQTVAELLSGAYARGWGTRSLGELRTEIGRYAVLHSTTDVIERFALVRAHGVRTGQPIATADCWIAATALAHDVPLVTNNIRDFENIPGLVVLTAPDP
jgi:predicted nucleic acid-binding protein